MDIFAERQKMVTYYQRTEEQNPNFQNENFINFKLKTKQDIWRVK